MRPVAIADLPYQSGWLLGRALGLPFLFIGYLAYALTAFSRRLKRHVKSAIRLLLSFAFFIFAFLFSLVVLQACKEVDYDLRELAPAQLSSALNAARHSVASLASHNVTVAALSYAEQHASLISKAIVAVLLAPLFTNGIPAFVGTLRWLLFFPPNFLNGVARGFCGSFEYLTCAVSLRHHHKHPEW